jgi:ribosomal protein S18 acetylase RimI-like enzyme
VLVSRNARRQGVARLLMKHIDDFARGIGREMLTLDATSKGPANETYRNLGWEVWGTCKGYAKWPDGSPCDATFFRKDIVKKENKGGAARKRWWGSHVLGGVKGLRD